MAMTGCCTALLCSAIERNYYAESNQIILLRFTSQDILNLNLILSYPTLSEGEGGVELIKRVQHIPGSICNATPSMIFF